MNLLSLSMSENISASMASSKDFVSLSVEAFAMLSVDFATSGIYSYEISLFAVCSFVKPSIRFCVSFVLIAFSIWLVDSLMTFSGYAKSTSDKTLREVININAKNKLNFFIAVKF